MEKVFLNDCLIDSDKACIPVGDSGLLYGAGLFETMRSCNGVVFRLEDHLERLFKSAGVLSINISCDKKFITDAVYQTLVANNLADARLRLTITGGSMREQEERRSTLLITATDFQPYPAEYYKKGVLVVLCPFRQNTSDPIYGNKTINYFSRIIGLSQAHQKGAAEALWFTVDGRLAEGCVSNVFLVKDSKLFTPAVSTPALPGIARKTVCEIAAANSIELVEKDLSIDDLLGADEVFLTNVIMQVMPINSVEKHTVGDGKPGPVTMKLMNYFDEFVKDKCRK
jgi:branched-chain amino acid aminotransferase